VRTQRIPFQIERRTTNAYPLKARQVKLELPAKALCTPQGGLLRRSIPLPDAALDIPKCNNVK